MDKKSYLIIAVAVTIVLTLVSCIETKEEIVPENNGIDLSMNIIDNQTNILRINLDNKGEKIKIEDIYERDFKNTLVIGALGEMEHIGDGYFEVNNSIDFIRDNDLIIQDVKGIIIDPPNRCITDAYYDILEVIEERDVLFLLLDGFGYHQYQYALENHHLPFLGIYSKADRAISVYQPVTNSGLAAIITGKLPHENGVHSRSDREFKVDSVFRIVKDLGKNGKYIEGNIGILKTEIEPILNLDGDGDGYTDNEVMESTLQAIESGYNLIFSHFHGIDDAGHSYGDLSDETMETINRIDQYIEELIINWEGIVIITADHGMHSTEDGGNHGEFRFEDMIVPYIIIDRGNHIEQ